MGMVAEAIAGDGAANRWWPDPARARPRRPARSVRGRPLGGAPCPLRSRPTLAWRRSRLEPRVPSVARLSPSTRPSRTGWRWPSRPHPSRDRTWRSPARCCEFVHRRAEFIRRPCGPT